MITAENKIGFLEKYSHHTEQKFKEVEIRS